MTSRTAIEILPESRQNQQYKRTNSLGWAKSDCHTCVSGSRKCDRARPRCSTCIDAGVVCGGYVQKLDWNRASTLLSKPQRQRQASVQKIHTPKPASSKRPGGFTIVQETGHIRKARKARRKSASDEILDVRAPTVDLPSPISEPSATELAIASQRWQDSYAAQLQVNAWIDNFFCLPTETRQLLDFYKGRFSYTSLTFNVEQNPWHNCLPVVHEIDWLQDAAVALAERQQAHLQQRPEKIRVLERKNRALRGLAVNVNSLSPDAAISACLLLIALDYAESAFSNWIVHLRGACRLLEAHGGLTVAENNKQLRSQIAMLVWYDTTAALLSRRAPIFPRAYTEQLLVWQNDDEWTPLALNGCPSELLLEIYDIAGAASRTDFLLPGEAAAIEMRIWDARFQAEGEGVAAMTDCWRLGLLLYCARVFHTESDRKKLRTLAEEILGLVQDLPGDAAVQKQCLLPLILAGCEMDSERFRRIAIDYCERWKILTGIWIFESALNLLSSVWSTMDAGDNTVWWGDKVPRNSSESYLFG